MKRTARDAWGILGIPAGSPKEMVRAQYLRLVRLNHPDQYAANAAEQARHEEIMKQVTWAYQEIVQGRAAAPPPPPPRYQTRPRPHPFDYRELQCRVHGRWAVIYCTTCGAPLCLKCDESLSGYCAAHRPRGWF